MAAFQRRHYVAVANLFREALADRYADLFTRSEIAEIVERFIRLLEADNPRFQADRFRAAIYRDGVK